MNTPPFASCAIAIMVVAFVAASGIAAPPERTLPVDPVELVAGREVPGKPELRIERDGFAYLFATPQNKASFEHDPTKFEVADGGACGRMGPLSGLGDARRYAVHEGRIYLFASDGCRAGFLKDPGKYIENDDEKVFGSNEQVERGRAILDKAVVWTGGAQPLRDLKTFRATAVRKEKHGETEYAITNETVIAFPDCAFQRESWNESWFSTTCGPDGAAMASARGEERIADSRARAFRRAMSRWPIVILKAYVDGSPKADCPGLIVIADGEGSVGDVPVQFVKVWLNGAASRLAIETATGRPRQLRYRGRDGSMSVGDSVRTFTTFATVGGVTLPTAYTVSFNDNDLPSAQAKVDAFEINPVLADRSFKVPAK
jgi:YHS domain-containing protein